MGTSKSVEKHYRFQPSVIDVLKNRDKDMYPNETEFVQDAVKYFAFSQKIEGIEKRLDFLYQHLKLDTDRRTAEDKNLGGEPFAVGDLDLRL